MSFITLDVRDNATQYLQNYAPDYARRAMAYALASTGKFMREAIKREGIKASHGGYLGWRPLSPFSGTLSKLRGRDGLTRTLKVHRGRGKGRYRYGSAGDQGYNPLNLSTRTEPMAKIVSAVRSKTDRNNMQVGIGFLEPRMWWMVQKQAAGFQTAVTPRMRRLFFAIGLAIKKETTHLESPSRVWIEKIYERESGKARDHFAQRFQSAFFQLENGAKTITSPS